MTLKLIEISITELNPFSHNVRTHDHAQIAESIRNFGFTNPVLVDEGSEIIAGDGRLEAAKRLDLRPLPAIRVQGPSNAKKRHFASPTTRLRSIPAGTPNCWRRSWPI